MTRTLILAATLCAALSVDAREPRWPRPTPTPPPATGPVAAATTTANGGACTAIRPFYWVIGEVGGKTAGGSVGGSTYTQTTAMGIASASKIYYSAYVQQVRAGVLTAADVKFMTFKSGYSELASCRSTDTVGTCAARAPFVAATENLFDYGGGHMQKHAALNGLANMTAAAFGTEVNTALGTQVRYSTPQPAGGITTTPAETASFLRSVMVDRLILGKHLGDSKVCTKCAQALSSPVPEPWFYAVGHWVELDGTFSSPGAFGYYPWIGADKKVYGVIARKAMGGAWSSVQCGRLIRAAYRDGVAR